jgi:hypothetical protein
MGVEMTHTETATLEQLEHVAEQLRTRGFEAHVAPTMDEAQSLAIGLIPTDARVLTASSETLRLSGLASLIDDSGRFDALRPRLGGLDLDERRSLASTPEVVIGSVQAITEDGRMICASATGSQLAAYVYGAQRVIWIIGAQKIVPDVEHGLRRVHEHCFPLENARTQAHYGRNSIVAKVLLIDVEPEPGRATVILVGEPLGF